MRYAVNIQINVRPLTVCIGKIIHPDLGPGDRLGIRAVIGGIQGLRVPGMLTGDICMICQRSRKMVVRPQRGEGFAVLAQIGDDRRSTVGVGLRHIEPELFHIICHDPAAAGGIFGQAVKVPAGIYFNLAIFIDSDNSLFGGRRIAVGTTLFIIL